MPVDTDLKRIQRKVYLSYFKDGLWDILLGVFFAGWGIMVTSDFGAIGGGLAPFEGDLYRRRAAE